MASAVKQKNQTLLLLLVTVKSSLERLTITNITNVTHLEDSVVVLFGLLFAQGLFPRKMETFESSGGAFLLRKL